MERSKVKLTVNFLLIVLDLCLLGIVAYQNHSARVYEQVTRDQALLFLENHGIHAAEETIPWETALEVPAKKLPEYILPETPLPAAGLGESYEVRTMRRPETLLADFARGADRLNVRCTELTAVTEGYAYVAQADRAVLTPVWVLETDGGTYYLDCYDGTLRQSL